MPKIKTKAWIRDTPGEGFEPTDPPGFHYQFTGGYKIRNGKPDPVGEDDGPAGNVAFDQKSGSWEIKLKDQTKQNFRIVGWHLKSVNKLGLKFDPAPGSPIEPTRKLSIDVDDVPADHKYEFEAFGVTLENDAGERFELDPRLYDIR
jgi:hypothetical protein